MLVDVLTGYPLMICDMTLMTALRTAAISTIVAKHCAKKDSKTIAFIGTGAQSEFQLSALSTIFNFETVKYFDIDKNAI